MLGVDRALDWGEVHVQVDEDGAKALLLHLNSDRLRPPETSASGRNPKTSTVTTDSNGGSPVLRIDS